MWEMWLAIYPNMDEQSFITFEGFKEKITNQDKPKKEKQTDEDMLNMVKMLNAAFGGEVVYK